jgi:hypothetical protein
MIAFIDEHRDRFGVEAICRTLSATACGFITGGFNRSSQHPLGITGGMGDGKQGLGEEDQ